MTRLYARTLMVLGLAGVLFAGAKLAVIPPAPASYYALPEGGPAHAWGCKWVDWTRTDLLRLAGPSAAKKRGLCEACIKGGSIPSTSSTQSRSPARAETARLRTRQFAD